VQARRGREAHRRVVGIGEAARQTAAACESGPTAQAGVRFDHRDARSPAPIAPGLARATRAHGRRAGARGIAVLIEDAVQRLQQQRPAVAGRARGGACQGLDSRRAGTCRDQGAGGAHAVRIGVDQRRRQDAVGGRVEQVAYRQRVVAQPARAHHLEQQRRIDVPEQQRRRDPHAGDRQAGDTDPGRRGDRDDPDDDQIAECAAGALHRPVDQRRRRRALAFRK
jgi:hypothetical protein